MSNPDRAHRSLFFETVSGRTREKIIPMKSSALWSSSSSSLAPFPFPSHIFEKTRAEALPQFLSSRSPQIYDPVTLFLSRSELWGCVLTGFLLNQDCRKSKGGGDEGGDTQTPGEAPSPSTLVSSSSSEPPQSTSTEYHYPVPPAEERSSFPSAMHSLLALVPLVMGKESS